MSYNGWFNYETWNVALWIQNDESLYHYAKLYKNMGYKAFIESLAERSGEIALQTPDGVAWNNSNLDLDALNEMMDEL